MKTADGSGKGGQGGSATIPVPAGVKAKGSRRRAVISALSREEIWAEVARHRGLCGVIAREFWNRGLDHDDLVQEGVFGLYRAIELFDAGRGIEFTTYAAHWIRFVMRRALIDQGQLIRSPVYAHKLAARLTRGRLDAEGLKPRRRECVLAAVAAAAGAVAPLDGEGRGPDLAEIVADRGPGVDPDQFGDALEAVARLDRREKFVIAQRFGLDGDDPKTLKQLAHTLGVTRERVRQIERRALGRLREMMAA